MEVLIFQKHRSIKEQQIFIKEYLFIEELLVEVYKNDCKISDLKSRLSTNSFPIPQQISTNNHKGIYL